MYTGIVELSLWGRFGRDFWALQSKYCERWIKEDEEDYADKYMFINF